MWRSHYDGVICGGHLHVCASTYVAQASKSNHFFSKFMWYVSRSDSSEYWIVQMHITHLWGDFAGHFMLCHSGSDSILSVGVGKLVFCYGDWYVIFASKSFYGLQTQCSKVSRVRLDYRWVISVNCLVEGCLICSRSDFHVIISCILPKLGRTFRVWILLDKNPYSAATFIELRNRSKYETYWVEGFVEIQCAVSEPERRCYGIDINAYT